MASKTAKKGTPGKVIIGPPLKRGTKPRRMGVTKK